MPAILLGDALSLVACGRCKLTIQPVSTSCYTSRIFPKSLGCFRSFLSYLKKTTSWQFLSFFHVIVVPCYPDTRVICVSCATLLFSYLWKVKVQPQLGISTRVGGGEGGGGGTWVKFCYAAGLSEPLPHYSLFCGQL